MKFVNLRGIRCFVTAAMNNKHQISSLVISVHNKDRKVLIKLLPNIYDYGDISAAPLDSEEVIKN